MNVRRYIRNSLETLGFSDGESAVYVAAARSTVPVGYAFLKEETKMSTSGIFKILQSLVEQGFLLPTKRNGTTQYAAISLEQVGTKLAAQGRTFARMAAKFRELKNLATLPAEAEIDAGTALTDYYLEIPTKIDDSIWCVGSFAAVLHFFGTEIERAFIGARIRKGKHADAIIFDDSRDSLELAGRDLGERRETRIIPNRGYPAGFSYLFGNTTLDFYKDADAQVNVVKTESPALARSRLLQYQAIWNSTVQ